MCKVAQLEGTEAGREPRPSGFFPLHRVLGTPEHKLCGFSCGQHTRGPRQRGKELTMMFGWAGPENAHTLAQHGASQSPRGALGWGGGGGGVGPLQEGQKGQWRSHSSAGSPASLCLGQCPQPDFQPGSANTLEAKTPLLND